MSTSLFEAHTEYVRAKTLATKLNCGVSTIWRMVQDGRLPHPVVRLGKRCTLWHWPGVEGHLIAQAAMQGGA